MRASLLLPLLLLQSACLALVDAPGGEADGLGDEAIEGSETEQVASDAGPTETPPDAGNPADAGTPELDAGSPITLPSQLLDLANWRLTLPLPNATTGAPLNISQPMLASFQHDTYFHLSGTKDAVLFQAHTGGTISSPTAYPRSELREMNGTAVAAWSMVSGTHTMAMKLAITHLPVVKPHLVSSQLKGTTDDLLAIRLEGKKLYIDVNGTDGPTLDADYQLGRIFEVKYVAADGVASLYYNGATTPAHTVAATDTACSFRAGVVPQSNLTTELGDGTAYGELLIYQLTVTHQ